MSTISQVLFMDKNIPKYKIHPLVICNILDNYTRRKENQTRVIGSLVGEKKEGYFEIKNSFQVPFIESENKLEVDIEIHHTMFELHKKVNPHDTIIGWFTTGAEASDDDLVIHDFYSKNVVENPVFLLVDAALQTGKLSQKAYISKSITLKNQVIGSQFIRVPIEYTTYYAEKIGVKAMLRSKQQKDAEPVGLEIEALKQNMKQLSNLLNDISNYVSKVLKGEIKQDKRVGRILLEALSTVQNAKAFEKVFNENIQDLLMVMYLSKVTQSQLSIAETIQNSL